MAIGPISFQPAEFGKVLIVIFLASYLADKREMLAAGSGRFSLPRAKDLGPLMIAWATSLAVLFLEKDLGASLLYFAVFVVMLWIASGRPMFLIVGLVLFVVGAWIGYLALSHVQLRVDYWLNALDPDKVYQLGYGQLAQGWFGMASGGIVGTGLGLGSPTLIPYAATDFIFAAIGEELGLLGTSAVLLIYLALIGRSLRVAVERDDAFGKLLATGLTTIVAVQTFVIVGGVTRLIPLTGITLPFVSYGGSSLVANFVILALLIRVSAGPWYRKVDHVNRRIRRLGVGLVALIGLLFLQVSYIQVFAAGRIAADPANARRQIIAEYKVERGQIITADGTVIALSEPTGANASLRYVRRYPEGPLFAGITGYYSQVYGRTELEQAMNSYLAGDAPELTVSTLADLVLGRPKKGGHVITTINARLQRVAAAALGTQPGAVVAMDPRSGDVLAMVSNPTFDPNELSSQDTEAVRAAWERLNADPSTPLLSRANDELFPPGSTFKMVTASAALENGYGLDSVWPNPHELDLPLTEGTIQNFGGETCPGGATTTMLTAFTNSLQRHLRRDRSAARGGRALRAGARVRLLPDRSARRDRVPGADDPVHDPVRDRAVPDPELLRGERPARRDLRDRAGQRPRQPAADGARGVRHREPRRDDDAQVGDADPRPAGARHPGVPRRGVRPADLGEDRDGDARDDGERRGQRDRHRGADPGLRGRGQDRHRAARRTRLGSPRMVRVLRARGTGRGPDDRGRGYRLGRRRPRERGDRGAGGRADRSAGPRGVLGGLGRGVR